MADPNKEAFEKAVDKILEDPTAKSLLLQKLGLDDNQNQKKDDETGKEDEQGTKDNQSSSNLTLSGKSAGAQWPICHRIGGRRLTLDIQHVELVKHR